jgi:hypothetical protein
MKILLIFIITIFISTITGCFENKESEEKDKIVIENAYCDLKGNFKFTIVNLRSENISLEFYWSLNDPMGDYVIYKDEGVVNLRVNERKTLDFIIPFDLTNYDPRYFIMHIELFHNDKKIIDYEEQKSPFTWDYSVIPPIKYIEKPRQVYISFETFIYKNNDNDIIIEFENLTRNPSTSAMKLNISEFYISLNGDSNEIWLTSELIFSSSNSSFPKFIDRDNDYSISNFDYYIIPYEMLQNQRTKNIEIKTVCPFVYRGWERGETLDIEDRNSIIMKNMIVEPDSPESIENMKLILNLESKFPIREYSLELIICDGQGSARFGLPLELYSNIGNNYTFSGRIEDIDLKDVYVPSDEYFFYITIEDNKMNERLFIYKTIV